MALLSSCPVYDGGIFAWQSDHGVADASDLADIFMSRVYDDACDIGFWVKSHRTGCKVMFTLIDTRHDSEGECVCWIFKSAQGFKANMPPITITVFND